MNALVDAASERLGKSIDASSRVARGDYGASRTIGRGFAAASQSVQGAAIAAARNGLPEVAVPLSDIAETLTDIATKTVVPTGAAGLTPEQAQYAVAGAQVAAGILDQLSRVDEYAAEVAKARAEQKPVDFRHPTAPVEPPPAAEVPGAPPAADQAALAAAPPARTADEDLYQPNLPPQADRAPIAANVYDGS